MKRCPYCHEYIQDDAIKCRFCGSSLTANMPPVMGRSIEDDYFVRNNAFDSAPKSGKSRGVTALLAIFFGGLGIHYFYLGKISGGLLTILLTVVTCTLWQIIVLIQGIVMFIMDNRTFCQKYVETSSNFPLF